MQKAMPTPEVIVLKFTNTRTSVRQRRSALIPRLRGQALRQALQLGENESEPFLMSRVGDYHSRHLQWMVNRPHSSAGARAVADAFWLASETLQKVS
jgi:hypothetical protein